MSNDPKSGRSDQLPAHAGSADWVAAQETPRGRLETELLEALRDNQIATQQMDETAGLALGVTNRNDGRCLDIIDQRGRISAGELAVEAGLTTGAITAVLDRLEGLGWVRRIADPDDRRRVLVEVTEQEREAAMRLYWPLGAMAAEWMGARSDDDLRLLVEYHRLSARINRERAAQIRAELEAE
jgi:DNA-binding MarR family transcriptional regulator